MSELPCGWATVTIGRLISEGRALAYGVLKPGEHVPDGVLLLKGYQVRDGYIDASDRFLMSAGLDAEFARTRLRGGEVLLTIVGSVGRSALVPPALVGANVSRAIAVIPVMDELGGWVHTMLRTPQVQALLEQRTGGTAQPVLNLGEVRELPLPVPPINEQRRIVAKLEALQARSRRAREALDAVPPLLEKLRQSILAAAFRGDLTKDWRAKHKDVEPSNISDGQDTTYRKKHLWGSGRTAAGIDDAWGALPGAWRWVLVRDLNEDPREAVQIGPMSMKSSEFVSEGITVLNVGCVQRGRIDISKADHLPVARARAFGRYTLKTGDVLFTRSGTVGRCACLPEEFDSALMTFHLLRVRPSVKRCLSPYLMYAFQGCGAVAAQIEASSVGATRAGFNTRLLEEMWIPLAPPEEQRELLSRLSELISRLNVTRAHVEQLQLRLAAMDQAKLAKAFRGELVAQDPNDEPAEAMLARVRSANSDSPTNGAKAKPRGRGAFARNLVARDE